MSDFIENLIIGATCIVVAYAGYETYATYQNRKTQYHVLCVDHGISVYTGDAYDVTALNSGISFRTSNIGTLVVVRSGACAIQEIK